MLSLMLLNLKRQGQMTTSKLAKGREVGLTTARSAQEDHSSRGHALCSASGSERWLNCPGSVGLSLDIPEEPSSEAAMQGTRCHELAEKILKYWVARNYCALDSDFSAFVDSFRDAYRDTEHMHDSGKIWSMVDYALTYVHACMQEYLDFDAGTEVSVRLEHRLTFNADMKMFGTADFFATGTRGGKSYGVVCDLKYGKKKVNTKDNSQLAFYACALKKASKRKLETVKVKVAQPRIATWFSEVEYSHGELDEWDLRLTLGAEKALTQIGSKKPELKTGGWCWFCPARNECPEKSRVDVNDCFDDDLVVAA